SSLISGVESQIAIVDWLDLAAFVFFRIPSRNDPVAPQRLQPLAHISSDRWITVRPARVIDAHRRILFQLIFRIPSRALIYFPKSHAHARLLAIDVDAAGVGKISFQF